MINKFKIGDPVILTKSIYDDGEDHHPPGYIACIGEKVYIKEIYGTTLEVAHEYDPGSFIISEGEYKQVT